MSFLFLEGIKSFFTSYLGSMQLVALIVFIVIILLLLLINPPKDAILLIPLPILVALGSMGLKTFSVIAYIIAGFYFSRIILAIYDNSRF